MEQRQTLIQANDVEKFYGAPDGNRIQVVAPLNLSVYSGQIVALLGPSGSGKSTLLRMMAGLSKPSAGRILWNGSDAKPSNLAIVFQSFALFPWLTVQQNVEAPLQAQGLSATDREQRSSLALQTVGLDGFESAYPKELSGGMKQRVGFARALIVEPEVLFMDEPFSALDVLTAENLRNQVIELWSDKKLRTQAIFIVTHNIEEAVLLADRIIVLGKNPARVRTDFLVDLSQPRDRKSSTFTGFVDYIYQVLTQPGADPLLLFPDNASTPKKPSYQMLPHARPGAISGFLEMLVDHQGPTDLYRLAEDLGLELDDLLPIIEAGAMLGFLRVQQGDIEITETGSRFANADIIQQKDIFSEAAGRNIVLLNQIGRALTAKSNHRVPAEFFGDILGEHFSEEEADRQLQTAINWGRYADLFEYDAGEQRFYLLEPEAEETKVPKE
jgi:NitT/TauT family transport system ATP-binding protein